MLRYVTIEVENIFSREANFSFVFGLSFSQLGSSGKKFASREKIRKWKTGIGLKYYIYDRPGTKNARLQKIVFESNWVPQVFES